MINAQKNEINAKEIGYMSYNKLNVFMTTLLLGFSITFAILGDRVKPEVIGIVFGILLASLVAPFVLALIGKFGIANNDIIITRLISLTSMINYTYLKISFGIVTIIILSIFVSPWFWLLLLLLLPLLLPLWRLLMLFLYDNGYKEIFAAFISIISIVGIGHLLLPFVGAIILDIILFFLLGSLAVVYFKIGRINHTG